MPNSRTSLSLLTLCLLAGCAQMPYRASPQDAAAKSYAVAPGAAAIYVYWPGSRPWMADQPGIPVTVDGRAVGRLFRGTFMYFPVKPGERDVWLGWDASTPITAFDPLNRSHTRLVHLPIRALDGQAIFVRADLSNAAHRLMEPTAAKTELSACCILIEVDNSATRLVR